MHFSHFFKASCEFRILLNHVSSAIFGHNRGMDRKLIGRSLSSVEIEDYRSQLKAWFDALPDPLTAEKAVLPAQLKLQSVPHRP
jgi:hypothetical protein